MISVNVVVAMEIKLPKPPVAHFLESELCNCDLLLDVGIISQVLCSTPSQLRLFSHSHLTSATFTESCKKRAKCVDFLEILNSGRLS